MAITDKDLQAKRDKVGTLRAQLIEERSKRAQIAVDAENAITGAALDAEIENITAELDAEKAVTAAQVADAAKQAEEPAPEAPASLADPVEPKASTDAKTK